MTKPSAIPDAALLLSYANGDRQAAQILTTRLLPRVLGQATRMLHDPAEAEDVAQEAMMRLWKLAPDWQQDKAQVGTWLYRVVANMCIDRIRRRRGNVTLDAVAEPADPAPAAAEQLQQVARMKALRDGLAALPERQAQAVSLRHLEGLSNPEIAQIMDISVASVESLTARGKRALAAALADQKDALGYADE